MEEIYTVAEIAEMFKVSTRTVYRWISKGELQASYFGGSVRITRSSLSLFLEEANPIKKSK